MDTLIRQRGDGASEPGATDPRPDGKAGRQVDRIAGVGLLDGRVVDVDISGGVVVAVTEAGDTGVGATGAPGPAVV
ncbi:cytosine deaminase, partial [Dietzia sp. SLG310A2-38A2]|nr:cytosine deaminase [Dietzia sp. SLG310A2-38A2]